MPHTVRCWLRVLRLFSLAMPYVPMPMRLGLPALHVAVPRMPAPLWLSSPNGLAALQLIAPHTLSLLAPQVAPPLARRAATQNRSRSTARSSTAAHRATRTAAAGSVCCAALVRHAVRANSAASHLAGTRTLPQLGLGIMAHSAMRSRRCGSTCAPHATRAISAGSIVFCNASQHIGCPSSQQSRRPTMKARAGDYVRGSTSDDRDHGCRHGCRGVPARTIILPTEAWYREDGFRVGLNFS